jgi:hypothetical protein
VKPKTISNTATPTTKSRSLKLDPMIQRIIDWGPPFLNLPGCYAALTDESLEKCMLQAEYICEAVSKWSFTGKSMILLFANHNNDQECR